jgi:glycoside/pentoside/hexuronide:cation symporter, GPH family
VPSRVGFVTRRSLSWDAPRAMPEETRTYRTRLTLATTFAYAIGAVAFGVKESGLQLFLMLFYGQVLGLPEAWVATGILLALIIDALIDPLVGQFSDDLASRWGRRHPLLYAAALPAGGAYACLWNPPAGLSPVALFGYFFSCLVLVRVLLAFVEIPGAALTAELTPDYDHRTALISQRTLCSWCGALLLNTFTFRVLLADSPGLSRGILRASGYHTYGLLAGALMASCTLVAARGTHHLIPDLKRPRLAVTKSSRRLEIRAALGSPALRLMLWSGLFGAMATGIVTGLDMYVGVFFWRLSSGQMATFPIVYLVAVVLAILMVGALSRKLGKRRAALATGLAGVLVGPFPVLATLLGAFPARESTTFFPLLLAFCGTSMLLRVTTGVLCISMLTDVVEEHELRTHKRSEGLITAGTTLIQKTMSGVGVLASGLILTIVDFPRNAQPGSVEPALLRDLVLYYVPPVTALGITSVLLLARYPIDRKAHERNLQLLARASPQVTS